MKKYYFLLVILFWTIFTGSAQSNPAITLTLDDNLPYTPQNIALGDVINYNIIVTNTGNVTLNNINITDINATIQGNSVINTLAPGASEVLTATHTVTQADLDNGWVSNSATGTTTYNGTTISDISDDTDPDSPAGNDDPTITTFVQTPNLEVTKDDQLPYTPQNLAVGDVIYYQINVTNTGNVTLQMILVSDNNAAIISGNPIANLYPGSTAVVIAQHTVTQGDIDAGQIVNSATATTTFNGQGYADLSDDTDPATPVGPDDPTITHIAQTPGLTLILDDQLSYLPQNLGIGDNINYILVVTNSGNVTLNDIAVSFDNATTYNSTIASLAPGEAATVLATHIITQADLNTGYVSCQATGTVLWHAQTITDLSDDNPTNTIPDEPTITHLQTNSINNYWANKIKVYPTIATDFISVQSDELKIQKLKIINILGQTQAEPAINQFGTYPLTQLSAGTYLIIIETDKGNIIKKFIKG